MGTMAPDPERRIARLESLKSFAGDIAPEESAARVVGVIGLTAGKAPTEADVWSGALNGDRPCDELGREGGGA